jgi:CheY-like chemotaxis protein
MKFILIGEDDIDDEELLKEVFSAIDESFSLVFVNNGQKVILRLDALNDKDLPCLLVLDYNMPELNGAEILKQLKDNPRYDHIPKIIWTTSQSTTYREICLALGACDYIIKPSKVNELEDVVRYLLSMCHIG